MLLEIAAVSALDQPTRFIPTKFSHKKNNTKINKKERRKPREKIAYRGKSSYIGGEGRKEKDEAHKWPNA